MTADMPHAEPWVDVNDTPEGTLSGVSMGCKKTWLRVGIWLKLPLEE